MIMERRQFLYGVLAAGAVALGSGAVGITAANATTPSGRLSTDSAEGFLLSTGRRALAH
jgi:hypothetical protein